MKWLTDLYSDII